MGRLELPASCSQSKRATNCATPGYKVFQLWSNMWSTPIFDQLPTRGKVLSAQVSQGFPSFPRAVARTPGLLHLKQARYQLRYTRLWNCFICGLTCGLGRFLTNNIAELVPASGSVPAGCGVVVLSSWMGGICAQSRRATPGYEVVGRSGRILLNCAILSHMELENSMGIQTSSAVLDWSMC